MAKESLGNHWGILGRVPQGFPNEKRKGISMESSPFLNQTLNAILTIRFGLRRHKSCCHSYNLPDKYVKLIGTMATYNANKENEDEKIIEEALKLLV
ncbi:hypothetical protein ACLKA6_002098 [Drosophila palustris]